MGKETEKDAVMYLDHIYTPKKVWSYFVGPFTKVFVDRVWTEGKGEQIQCWSIKLNRVEEDQGVFGARIERNITVLNPIEVILTALEDPILTIAANYLPANYLDMDPKERKTHKKRGMTALAKEMVEAYTHLAVDVATNENSRVNKGPTALLRWKDIDEQFLWMSQKKVQEIIENPMLSFHWLKEESP